MKDIGDRTRYLSSGLETPKPTLVPDRYTVTDTFTFCRCDETYLLGVRLMLHSRHTRSSAWPARRRGPLPPWWVGVSAPKPSVAADDSLTHFWAVRESTAQGWGRMSEAGWVGLYGRGVVRCCVN